jgi:hypothetical protein
MLIPIIPLREGYANPKFSLNPSLSFQQYARSDMEPHLRFEILKIMLAGRACRIPQKSVTNE